MKVNVLIFEEGRSWCVKLVRVAVFVGHSLLTAEGRTWREDEFIWTTVSRVK